MKNVDRQGRITMNKNDDMFIPDFKNKQDLLERLKNYNDFEVYWNHVFLTKVIQYIEENLNE